MYFHYSTLNKIIYFPHIKNPSLRITNKKISFDSTYIQQLKWYNYQNIEDYNFLFYSNFSKCQLCNVNITPIQRRDDSQDIVICTSINRYFNIYPYVQSLRSTGSKAQILIVTDDQDMNFMKSNTPTFFEDCGVNIVSIGKYENTTKRLIYYTKFFSILFFLQSHKGFDRVFFSDISDVIFQRNPFQIQLPEKFFLVSTEGINGFRTANMKNPNEIKELEIILSVIPNINLQKTINQYKSNNIKRYCNSGVFMASSEIAEKFTLLFFKFLISLKQETIDKLNSHNFWLEEQDIYNVLINEIFFVNNPSILCYDFNTNYDLFSVYDRHYKPNQEYPNFKYRNDVVSVFHEIYMNRYFCESIKRKCLPLFNYSQYVGWKSQYYRC